MGAFDKKLGQRIKMWRINLGLSQAELAGRLGISRPGISLLENGERKLTADEAIRVANVFNISVTMLHDLEKEPEVILSKDDGTRRDPPQIRISVPQKNLKKFKEVLLYILNKVGSKSNIGETVIYKLLYFIDFNYYEKYEEQLIGATYMKNKHGPTPIEFKKIVDNMIKEKEIERVKSEYYNFPQTKYLPLRKPDLESLKASEMQMIDDVLNRLSDMNASQISDHSHNDVPWLTTPDGKVIQYESVFYRTAPYSVRSNEENLR